VGPGEYGGLVVPIFLGGDSVLALDLMRDRANVLAPDLSVARSLTTSFRGQVGSFVLMGRTLVGAGPLSAAGPPRDPLHLFSPGEDAARIVRSFGAGAVSGLPEIPANLVHWLFWKLAPGRNNTYWSADLRQYRLIHWSGAHSVIATYVRTPGWLLDTIVVVAPGRARRPAPLMQAIAEDSVGLLWVATHVVNPALPPAPQRGAAVPPPPPGRGGRASQTIREGPSPLDPLEQYLTRVEVIDPRAGRVVTRTDFRGLLVSLLPGRRAAIYFEDTNGFPELRIVRFALSGA
jgi:hypothetical protein